MRVVTTGLFIETPEPGATHAARDDVCPPWMGEMVAGECSMQRRHSPHPCGSETQEQVSTSSTACRSVKSATSLRSPSLLLRISNPGYIYM
jgi:hypothetical protein